MPNYFLSIGAIIRDESCYLPEFLEFHILQGVEHFYLQDNGSVDNTPEVLAPYIKDGIITLDSYPGKGVQVNSYQKILSVYGKETEWIAFIDADEFMFCRSDINTPLAFTLAFTLAAYTAPFDRPTDEIAGLAIAWQLFGSSGHMEKPDGLVIENFIHTGKFPDKHVKSVVRPAFIKSVGHDPHTFYPKEGYLIIDEQGRTQPKDYAINKEPGGRTNVDLCVNHYHTKDYESYLKRRSRPDVGTGVYPSKDFIEEKFRVHDMTNIIDTYLKDTWAAKVKENILKRYAL